MKQISHGRIEFSKGAWALALSLSLNLCAHAGLAQEGSLDDLWQEHSPQAQPAAKPDSNEKTEEASEKSSKKSKKSKKSKALEDPVPQGGDLSKSPEGAAPASSGWESSSSAEETRPAAATTPAPRTSATSTSSTSTTTTTETSGSALSRPVTSGTSLSLPSSSSSSTTSSTKSTTSTSSTPDPTPSSSAPASTTATTSSAPSRPAVDNSTVAKLDSPTQPLCKLTTLTSSDLIKSGGWPGVGPFAQDQTDDSLIDESKNRLKLKLAGEDVTHAELLLINQTTKPSQILALQMNADFLLEAVGAQPGKIAEFNNALLQQQERLSNAEKDGQVNLKAGTYVVQIQRKPAQDATVPGNVSFLIALDNQKPTVIASAATKTDNTQFSVYTQPSTTHTTSSTPATTTTTTTATPGPKQDDLLHRQFANLVSSWQQVKRNAVKTRQAASLTRILGGKALATQNRALEWLLTNKKYYEMTPLELKVQSYKEITPGAKFEVETFIKERQQLVSADTMKVEKDSTKSYNVVYTVEKIRGAWLITDTRMVTPTPM